MADLILFHTNDTHGRFAIRSRGEPPLEDRVREVSAEYPDAVMLDAGDAVSAGNLGYRPGGEPALEVMSNLGYAAMCLGNRESHPRRELFPLKLDRARFPIVSANLLAKGDAPRVVCSHVIVERAALRVGVFGVSVPMFTRKQWSQPFCDYWFDDPVESAKREVAELRPHVDVLIALTHIGYRHDQALAAACPDVDLVIGGHSHTDLQEPTWVGDVPVLQAWAFGFYAGIAHVEIRGGRGRLAEWTRRRLRE